MSDSGLGKAVLELSTDSATFFTDLDRVKTGAKGIEADFKKAGESAKGFGATLDGLSLNSKKWSADTKDSFKAVGQAAGLLLGAIGAVGAGIILLGQRGADVDDVSSAFNRLSADAPAALAGLRAGIGGLLTDYDLMKPANAAMSAGFQMNAADAQTMARAAWILADAQGKDLKESYETIANAMATGKVQALGALGLNVELKGASLALKTALGAEGEAITSNAQKQANRQAAMEAMNRVVLAAGAQELDFGEKLTRVKVQIGNMTDSLGVAIASSPVLGVAMNSAGDALQSAFGANQTQTIQALVKAIGQIAIMAVQTATFVVAAASEMASAYYKTRAAVDTLFQAFNDREIARVQALVTTYEAIAATSTTATSTSKLRLQELQIELARLKGVSKGFDSDANDSLATQAKLAAANEKAQKFLDDMIRSMQLAQAQGVSATAIAKGLAQAHVELAGGVHVATAEEKEQAKAIAEILAAAIPLTAAQMATAVANEKLGISAETTAKALGISAAAVTTYLNSVAGIKEIAAIWDKAHVDMLDDSKKFINKALADSTAARQKEADASGKALAEQLATRAEYEEKNYQLTLTGTDLIVRQAEVERQARLDAIPTNLTGPLYDQAAAQINKYYDSVVAGAERARHAMDVSQVLGAVVQAFATLGQSAHGALGQILTDVAGIGSTLQSAMKITTKAGGAGTGGILTPFFDKDASSADKWGAAIQAGVTVAQGAMEVWSATANDGTKSAAALHGAMAGAKAGAAFGPYGMAVGAVAGAVLGMVHAMTIGRRTVEDFAKSFDTKALGDGFDELHAKMAATLGDAVSEKFWIQLTQGVKKGDKAGAEAVIAAIQNALAAAPSTLAAAAGYQTTVQLQAVADKAKQVYDFMLASGQYSASELAKAFQASADATKAVLGDTATAQQDALDAIDAKYKDSLDQLDSEFKTLSDSVGAEAEEAEMGVIETRDRARMAQIEKEKTALEDKKAAEIANATDTAAAVLAAAADAAKAAAEAADAAFRAKFEPGYKIPITFTYPDGSPGGFTLPPSKPMASGGFGRVTTPTLFYSAGDEDYAFSGEGSRFGQMASRQPTVIENRIILDGRELARNQVKHIPSVLAGAGL
jgi:predicted transcriptional regulator